MRNIIFIAGLLSLLAFPAFADDDDDVNTIPEPGAIALVGIGAAAYLVTRRKK